MQNNNNFQISGFIAQDAQIRQFTTASVARFPLAVARTEKIEGEDKRVSALMRIECWRKNETAADFELLAKGNRVQISGYFRPDEWTDKNGVKHNHIIMVAQSVEAADAKAEDKKTKKEVK